MYKIGEFASICKTTTKTLRLYDKIGILSPEFIDENTDYRYYSAKNVSEFNKIKVLKKLGFTLMEISNCILKNKNSSIVSALIKKENELIYEMNVIKKQIEELNKIKYSLREDILMDNNIIFDGNVNINVVGLGNIGCNIVNQIKLNDINYLNFTTIDYDLKSSIKITNDYPYDKYYKDIITSICNNHINIILYSFNEDNYLNNFILYLSNIINEINTFNILILIHEDSTNHYNNTIFDSILNINKEKIASLCYTIQHLTELLKKLGVVNIEYIDFINLFKESKEVYLGVGKSKGKERAINAVKYAISDSIISKNGRVFPSGLYVNVSLPVNSTLDEVNRAIGVLKEKYINIPILWGAVLDNNLTDEIVVTLIARV